MAGDIISTALPSAGMGVVGAYLLQAVREWWKSRNDREAHRDSVDLDLEKHRDDLTFQLLSAAREEVAAARAEGSENRAVQLRLAHFDEALEHIELLILAKSIGPAEWDVAQRRAEQFLTRMRRWKDAAGALRNEAQVDASRTSLTGESKIGDALKDVI